MILRNLKTFIKHLLKNKLYTLITVLGFAISLMFVTLLTVYIQKEYSNDKFHVNKDRVYRLVHDEYSGFAPPSGPALMDKFSEIECFTRTYDREGYISINSTEKFKINYLMVDSVFLKMFSFPLIKGNIETALQHKSIVLTESYALKLYGKIPEIGQLLQVNDNVKFKIGGIMKDFPENTHFKQVDALIDFPSLAIQWNSPNLMTTYDNNSFGLYVMEKLHTNFASRAPDILELYTKVNWMYEKEQAKEVVFEPLTDVYFGDSYSPGIKQGSQRLLRVLSSIVILILLLSILNYINLTVAQSGNRSKEIAVKKLMGSKRHSLLIQYTFESALITFISYLIGLALCFEAEPIFNYLLNTNLELSSFISLHFLVTTALGAILIGVISGIIPAITVSNFNPVDVVKGVFRLKSKAYYSKGLITFQYLIIVILIIGALFIDKQTSFMRDYDLGYNKDNVLVINNTIGAHQRNAFKSQLEAIAGVQHVCYVKGNPIDGGNNYTMEYKEKMISFQAFNVDSSFFKMMNMEVKLTGVAYSNNAILLNKTAVKMMELPNNPTSAEIFGKARPVYGVVKDFHFRALKEKVGPIFFSLQPKQDVWSIMVKVSNKNTFNTVQQVKSTYTEFTHGLPITMSFMDESINQWYESENRIGQLIKYFTLLTVIISIMGLFAMSMYYVQQKTKEIGVRKVNGAKVIEILTMLNKNFMTWVAVAYILACPIAYYAMNKWLENFAYKTEISWWIFALAGFIALMVALITVSWQSWKAATRNPVEALRYE
ncbi:ABC transporter permease [Labilibacter marinus]|uniref:ABC transporter permease n=1 Tax=Labilibacter marinus TaxID=1477105 RepID=UPI0008FF3D4C|nr:ABC transporter permease [Labilibacter marinus]